MAHNPLKKYFRQPKIYLTLPSQGIFCEAGTIAGDVSDMPVYGMTGMDELLMKTPDALLNGESTVKVIESCIPSIKNAWGISILDLDPLLIAIRIATYGNTLTVSHTCEKCEAVNDYEMELGNILAHFKNVSYDNKIVMKDLTISVKPLNYKEWTEIQLKTFGIQRQVQQALQIQDPDEQQSVITNLYSQLNEITKEALMLQIDSVQVPEATVNQKDFIVEWLHNTEQDVFDALKAQVEKNRNVWEMPKMSVQCSECGAENQVGVVMDQSSFFGNA